MVEIAAATTTAAPNCRYYIGAGSRHTAWGNDKVYSDTTGGVMPLVDWVNATLAGSASWQNVQCAGDACGTLLPGDPRPSTPIPPFTTPDGSGNPTRIDCGV